MLSSIAKRPIESIQMSIDFFILHYKNSDITKRCLDSILEELRAEDRAVIVDASHDFDAEEPGDGSVTVMRTPEVNPGFARAMNWGAFKYAPTSHSFLCFVNNDTVIAPGFRAATLAAFNHRAGRVSAVGPKIVYLQRPDVIWSAGGYVSRLKMAAVQTQQFQNESSVQGEFETNFLSGCVITLRSKDFYNMGGWPDTYLFGGEEWELSTRLRRAGKSLVVAAEALVFHEADFDGGQGMSHNFSDLRFVLNGFINRVLYAENNFSLFESACFRFYLAVYICSIIPFRWHAVGTATAFGAKFRLCRRISSYILMRPRCERVTWSELSDFSACADLSN